MPWQHSTELVIWIHWVDQSWCSLYYRNLKPFSDISLCLLLRIAFKPVTLKQFEMLEMKFKCKRQTLVAYRSHYMSLYLIFVIKTPLIYFRLVFLFILQCKINGKYGANLATENRKFGTEMWGGVGICSKKIRTFSKTETCGKWLWQLKIPTIYTLGSSQNQLK